MQQYVTYKHKILKFHFDGEIANKSFYYVSYSPSKWNFKISCWFIAYYFARFYMAVDVFIKNIHCHIEAGKIFDEVQ